MNWRIPFIGMAIGLALAIPVGPVGLMVFRRSLLHRIRSGLITGMGAALADSLLCAVLAFGITAISDFISQHRVTLENCGGVLLLVIGYFVWHTSPPNEMPKTKPPCPGWFGDFSSALLLTLGNPMTIIGAGGIFAGFAVAAQVSNRFDAALLISGVFSGSMLWWVTLCFLAGRLREKASGYWMRRINQGCGIAVAVFGLVQIVRVTLGAFGH
jgi:threonine/homoserine/homoserine lactone efflux protein